jgi:hypothetical protein
MKRTIEELKGKRVKVNFGTYKTQVGLISSGDTLEDIQKAVNKVWGKKAWWSSQNDFGQVFNGIGSSLTSEINAYHSGIHSKIYFEARSES